MAKKTSLTVNQVKAIELLATGQYTQRRVAEILEISETNLSEWKKDEAFMEALVQRSRELLKDSLPEIYDVLAKKSKTGSDKHIKIFLDHLEKLEGIKSSAPTINFTWKTKETQTDLSVSLEDGDSDAETE